MLRQSGGALDVAAGGGVVGGDQAGKKPVDSVTLGRAGLVGEEEEARVMPVLRLAVVKDDQASHVVRWLSRGVMAVVRILRATAAATAVPSYFCIRVFVRTLLHAMKAWKLFKPLFKIF